MSSKSSRVRATKSVDRLVAGILSGSTVTTTSSKGKTSAEILSSTFNDLNKVLSGSLKKAKRAQKQAIKKKAAENKALEKKVKLQIIQQHIDRIDKEGKSGDYQLTEEEKTMINSLIDKNVKNVQSWKDSEILEEIKQLQEEILKLKEGSSRKKESDREIQMGGKKKKKDHAYPGLTPGLAPVDLEDSDSDEEDY